MNAAQFCGLRQALALDHRPRVIEPTLLLAQMRQRRLGQGVEGASATLAAQPQQPMRTAPADDLAACAMRAALAFHPFMAGRAKRILAATALRAFRRRSPRRHAFSCRACPVCVRFRQRTQRFSPLRRAQARNPRKPQHASNQLLDPAPNLILWRFPINLGTARKELEWFRKWCLCAGWAPKARWRDGSGYSPGCGKAQATRRLRARKP